MSANWNGVLASAVLISFAVTIVVAPPLLFVIRFSIGRFMRRRGRSGPAYVPPPGRPRPEAPALHLENVAAPSEPLRPEGKELFARARRARFQAAAVYLLAGLAAACVLAAGNILDARNPYLGPFGRLVLFSSHTWPAILTFSAAAVPSFRTKAIVLPLAAGLLAAIAWAASGAAILWLVLYGPPTVLLLFAANRWLKTIAPVVLLLGTMAVGAFFLGADWFVRFGCLIGVVSMVVAAAAGLLAYALIVRAYERKRFSDLSFHLAFVWMTFALWYAAVHAASAWWWLAFVAIALYAIVTGLTLPLLRREARRHRPVSLLVLRVFGAPARSQTLFEQIGTRWRTIGPIHLIAGPDSVIANLDISELAHLLTLRQSRLYVTDRDDLERRLAHLDTAPDPDGRYRVNDFFCFDDTWKPTFTRLLAVSDVVLVDLSGFGPRNAGVSFELAHLMARRPLDSFVLVTDDDTSADHLAATLTRLWRELDPSLPNARLANPVLRVFHNPRPRRLVAALCDAAAAGGRVQSPA